MSASLAMRELMSDPSKQHAPQPPPGRSTINRKRPQTGKKDKVSL